MFTKFVFPTVGPGMVVFNQPMNTLTSITISWATPSSDNGVVVEYVIQSTNNGTSTTENTTEVMYVLEDLIPSTRVEFSVSAVSICGLVGEPSNATEHTDNIRK